MSHCLSCLRAFANTSYWKESFLSSSLNIVSVKFLLEELIHLGPWASVPAHSCQGCQEHKALTTHYPGQFSALCLQRAILKADVASRLLLTVKMVNSLSSGFFSYNTALGMCKHPSRPTCVPHGIWGAWEPGVNIILVLVTVLWLIKSLVSVLSHAFSQHPWNGTRLAC